MKNLTVIVINYNRLDYLKRTLSTLFKTTLDVDFIIYDNASTEPGFYEYFKDPNFSNVQFIIGNKNLGWGAAVNEALTFTKPSNYILISNNDVEYKDGWFEKGVELLEKYSEIGVLGVWKHTAHRTLQLINNELEVRDNTPAVGWLFKTDRLKELLPFPEHGPCATKGGNGEDTSFCIRTQQKGFWVANPTEDIAVHIDGY